MLDKSTFTPHGRHLIAGEWVSGETTFSSEPAHGPAHDYSVGTPALVDRAAEAAEEAFWSYGYSSREERAAFLNAIADEIEDAIRRNAGLLADELLNAGMESEQEDDLPDAAEG